MASIISPFNQSPMLACECGSYSEKMRPPVDVINTSDLDLRGLKCPLPVLYTRKALRRLAPGARLVVTCTDPLASIDIPHLVQTEGYRLEGQSTTDETSRFVIVRGETPAL